MKKFNSLKKWLVAVIAFLTINQFTQASHLVGSYMWYTHISGNDYILHLRYFRDCSGIPAAVSADVCFRSASTSFSGTINLPQVSSIQAPLNSCAPQGLTYCNGGSDYGVEQYDYEATLTLPGQASDWIFEYTECCRNGALTTMTPNGLYTYCTLDNLTSGANSSPMFPTPFIGLYCAGILTNIDYSTTDADGDSIVYSLVSAEDATVGCPIASFPCTYYSPYSPLQPMASFTPITLNSSTGLFSFTPALLQVGEVCILVEEYRNGVKIGSVKRDDQIVIVSGITNPAKIEGTVYGDYNNNGVQDVGENGWAGINIVAAPANVIATTDANGFYSVDVIPGTYNIGVGNAPQWYTANPANYNINVTSLGQTFSTNNFGLVPTANITDLSVVVAAPQFVRPGWHTTFRIEATNEGTLPEAGTLSFMHDFNYTYVSSTPNYDTYSSNYMTWSLPTINPGQTLYYEVEMYNDSTLQDGDTLIYEAMVATVNSDSDPADNKWTNYQIVSNSYDPNFIEVDPAGNVKLDFVTNRNWLYYTVHFQNTGGANALDVIVKNGLDFNADAGSVEFVSSSHPCLFSMSGIGLMEFQFPNINLPSSFVNEPASHGYVMYRVKTKPTLTPGDLILNAAGIYFDLNPAVNTNTVSTLVVTNPTAVSNLTLNNMQVSVYPNPVGNELNILFPENNNITFEIFDVTGKLLMSKNISSSSVVNLKQLAQGVYVYRLTSSNGETATGKLMKK